MKTFQHPAGNPKPIAQIASIGKGAFTEIVDIVAPSSAGEGEMVSVTVKIKNLWTASVRVYCVAVLDSTLRFIDWLDYWIPAGATHSFYGSFIMPDESVTINAYSYYEDINGYLQPDDSKSKDVALAEVFEGSIRKRELDYEDMWQVFPIYNIPTGTRIRVRITGRNDMATTQRMGIHWIVKDPDGVTIQEYSTWEAWPYTGAGSTHEFIGGSFDLNKAGTYTIQAWLLMNLADQVVVDDYYGTLCTVEAAVSEPEFSGFAIAEYERT